MGKLRPCRLCGAKPEYSTPEQAGDADGYHYYCCPNSNGRGDGHCPKDPCWGKTMTSAAKAWNLDNEPTAAVRDRSKP